MKTEKRSFAASTLAVAACLAIVAGCGNPNVERQHIQGKVTFRGKPVTTGQILFNPVETEGKGGARGGARIVDGHFDTSGERGLAAPVGQVTVLVTGFSVGEEDSEAGPGDPLFKTYKTTLEVTGETTTFDVDVP